MTLDFTTRLLKLVTSFLAVAVFTASAQAPVRATRIPNAPSCRGCRIEFSLEVTFGDENGPGSFAQRPSSVVRDSKGNYYALAGLFPPQKFDSTGKYIRTLGRKGDGPGELTTPVRLTMTPADTLYVFEGTGEVSVFAGPDGRFIRAGSDRVRSTWVGLWNEGMLVGGRGTSPATAGFFFHVINRDGKIVRSFGGPTAMPATKSVAANHGVWLATIERYQLTRMDSTGRVTQVLERDPPWFRDAPRPWRDFTVPPPSGIIRINEDRSGLLWVVATVPGPDWRAGVPVTRPDGSLDLIGKIEILNNNVVEVLDPKTRKLIASAPFPGYILDFVDDGRVLFPIEGANGFPRAQIWKIKLIRP